MKKKAVFFATLNSKSDSGRQRLWALEQCGIEVSIINFDNYPSKFGKLGEIVARISQQPHWYKDVSRMQSEILLICKKTNPSILWFEWPKFFKPAFLKKLRILFPETYFICFQDDNPWGDRKGDFWWWKNYLKIIPFFDLHIIKRESDADNLIKLGAKHCYKWIHGIYSPLFYPINSKIEPKYPVSFVGTCMDNRVEIVEYLLVNNIPLHVFGNHWSKRSTLPQRFPDFFHDTVHGEDYANVIRSSQICLGFVSHSNHDEWTMRTFEVPGCAKLLLAMKTPFHEKEFEEGKEIELFTTKEECLVKLRFLLNNKDLSKQMGINSYKKVLKKGRLIETQMKQLLEFIDL